MRVLVVIPHYFGPGDPSNSSPAIASYVEPFSKIASLNETIVCLHRNFGRIRNTFEGADIVSAQERGYVIDVVIVTIEGRNVIPHIGLSSEFYSVRTVDCPPTGLPFQVQGILREHAGAYDYYCLMEDDLAIHDPEFFAKLQWFEATFGHTKLLAPTRVETSFADSPGKVIVDPLLKPDQFAPFRRVDQIEELRGTWNGREWSFRLPCNPHAACYFLSARQLAHWLASPSFDDRDASWIGPVESAVTLGIGKVFDIYKAAEPDPFFLEIHHYGTSYASRHPPAGRRYGEPPLLAIAQNAAKAILDRGGGALDRQTFGDALTKEWIARGTAAEYVAGLTRSLVEFRRTTESNQALSGELAQVQAELAHERARAKGEAEFLHARLGEKCAQVDRLLAELDKTTSLRWLLQTMLSQIRSRFGRSN